MGARKIPTATEDSCDQATALGSTGGVSSGSPASPAWAGSRRSASCWPGRPSGAGEPARSVILLWLAGGPSQLETFDPHPGHDDRRRHQGDRDRGQGRPARRGLRAAGRPDGLGRAGPLDGEQGGGPRARDVHDEDRATGPTRPSSTRRSGRSAATSCPSAGPTSPGTSRSCPASGRAAAASSAASTTPSRSDDPEGKLPDVTAPVPGAARRSRGCSDLDVVERAFARGRRGRRRRRPCTARRSPGPG